MHHLHFHYLAILVSGLILWFLGAIWYSPALFSKPWMAMIALPEESKKKGMITGMVSSFIGDLLLAFVLAHIIRWAGAATFGFGAFIGFIIWVGFFVATGFPQGAFEGRPLKLFAITYGYWLIGLTVVGGLLAAWQ